MSKGNTSKIGDSRKENRCKCPFQVARGTLSIFKFVHFNFKVTGDAAKQSIMQERLERDIKQRRARRMSIVSASIHSFHSPEMLNAVTGRIATSDLSNSGCDQWLV